jgi:hypothetical protein
MCIHVNARGGYRQDPKNEQKMVRASKGITGRNIGSYKGGVHWPEIEERLKASGDCCLVRLSSILASSHCRAPAARKLRCSKGPFLALTDDPQHCCFPFCSPALLYSVSLVLLQRPPLLNNFSLSNMLATALVLSSVALFASAANYDVTVGGLDNSSNPILQYNPPVRL